VSAKLVQVYSALGGGWEIRENADPVDSLPTEMKDEMRERSLFPVVAVRRLCCRSAVNGHQAGDKNCNVHLADECLQRR